MKLRQRLLAGLLAMMTVGGVMVSASSAGASTAQVKRGGTLSVVDNAGSWSSLSPEASSNTAQLLLYAPEYEGLFTYNTANQIVPVLATGYKFSANHLAVNITLRRGVTFSDGTPFNAAAAAFDIELMANPTINSECVPYFNTLSTVKVVNPYEVQAVFSQPYGPFISILAGDVCGLMVSPTAWQAAASGTAFGVNTPVGTGPYKVTSQVPGVSIHWVANPHYWQKGDPHFAAMNLTVVTSDTNCYQAVESGSAQICFADTAQDIPAILGVHSIKTVEQPPSSVENVRLDMSKPPFNNIWARKAVAQAVDTTLLTKTIYGRYAMPTQSYEIPSCFCSTGNRVHGYPQYSLAQARADIAKLPGGTLSFQLQYATTAEQTTEAEAIAGMMQSVGATVSLSPLTRTTLDADFRAKTYQAGITTTFAFPDPDDLYYRNFDSQSSNNQVGLNDPLIDSLTTEARETVSEPQRKALYLRVQQELAIDLPLIALYTVPMPTFTARNIAGLTVVGSLDPSFATVYQT